MTPTPQNQISRVFSKYELVIYCHSFYKINFIHFLLLVPGWKLRVVIIIIIIIILVIIIIIIIIIILVITFLEGIYKYLPETNHVSRVYSVAAVLYLQLVLHVKLFHPWDMFCNFTLALPAVCAQCPIWLLLYFLNFVISRYVSQVLHEWFWNGSSRPYYYWYHFRFHPSHHRENITAPHGRPNLRSRLQFRHS